MKKARKKWIIIAAILIIIIVTVIVKIIIPMVKKYQKVPVILNYWNDKKAQYTVCEIYGEVHYSTWDTVDRTTFVTEMTMDEIIETNKDDFLGMYTINYSHEKREAAVFFRDDNYFYIIKDEEEGRENIYYTSQLSGKWCADGMHNADIRYPFPDPFHIHDGMVELGKEIGYDYLGEIFNLYSFEDMKEFYSRLSDDLYTIDEENRTITVKAYGNTNNLSWEGGYRYDIIIDFNNRTISGPDTKGGLVELKRSADL